MRFLLILWLLALPSVAHAHIGSPTVFFEGEAGPYQLRVSIQPPEVVPGRARINVRIHNGHPTKVGALPVRWDAGRKGAPPPDVAQPVPGEAGLFTTELWLMDFGAYSVFVDVEGDLGKGTAIVPLNSVSTRRLPMAPWMAAGFIGFGVILLGLLIMVVGAAARESVLAPGVAADPLRIRRGRIAMGVGLVVLSAILVRGKNWWEQVDAEFRNNRLSKPVTGESKLDSRADGVFLVLNLEGTERDLRDHTPLVADHGKLMHLFLVQEPEMNAFAHLHPLKSGPMAFEVPLPAIPAGNYTVYADITHESGLTQTIVSRIQIPNEPIQPQSPDPDNSHWAGSATTGPDAPLASGCLMRMLSPATLNAGTESVLRFDVLAGDGRPAPIEPYMGMWSHAVIRKDDGTVYTHLHPSGTISLTSQELFARRERGEDLRKPIDVLCGRPERELVFPYSFPKPGHYRMWVQAKINGTIQTAAFDLLATVGPL